MKRYWEIDALRGLMLVLMTLTHLPSRLTDPMGQPLGFVSAAEGFVLLSAFMSGLIYSRVGYREGVDAMRLAFLKRAFKVYLAQAATLLFLFTIIAFVGLRIDQAAVTNLLSYYLAQPRDGFLFGLLLIYEPPLLDILPMYIFFMLMSPWVLA
ncbi:MAG: OpgC domain-containing protein, partial [Pseudomonadota bacterium]